MERGIYDKPDNVSTLDMIEPLDERTIDISFHALLDVMMIHLCLTLSTLALLRC